MYYSIYSEDCADSLEKRKAARDEHMVRMHQLQEEDRLLIAGHIPILIVKTRDPQASPVASLLRNSIHYKMLKSGQRMTPFRKPVFM